MDAITFKNGVVSASYEAQDEVSDERYEIVIHEQTVRMSASEWRQFVQLTNTLTNYVKRELKSDK